MSISISDSFYLLDSFQNSYYIFFILLKSIKTTEFTLQSGFVTNIF